MEQRLFFVCLRPLTTQTDTPRTHTEAHAAVRLNWN